VVGLVSGFVVLGEALGPLDLLGFVLVLAGVGAASLFPRASQPDPR
jgi:drug/metabolite transporter (DMT)-like permease